MKRYAMLATSVVMLFSAGCCCGHKRYYGGGGCDPCQGGAGYFGAPAGAMQGSYLAPAGTATVSNYSISAPVISSVPVPVTASRPLDALPTY